MSYKSIKDKWWSWYKSFYGTDPDVSAVVDPSLSGEEGEIGKAIFDAYLQSDEIEKNRQNEESLLGMQKEFAIDEVERLAKTSRQISDVTYQRLMKYIPSYLSDSGLSTSGQSETMRLLAENQLKEDFGKAEEQRYQGIKNADLSYAEGLADLDSRSKAEQRRVLDELAQKEQTITLNYEKKREEEEERKREDERYKEEQALALQSKKESESRNLFTAIVGNLFDENGRLVFGSNEEFMQYIDGLEEKLGNYYQLLKEIGDGRTTVKDDYNVGENPLFQTDDPVLKKLYECKTLEDWNYLKGGLTPLEWEKYKKDFETYKRLYILPGYEDFEELPDIPSGADTR